MKKRTVKLSKIILVSGQFFPLESVSARFPIGFLSSILMLSAVSVCVGLGEGPCASE